MSLGDLWLVVYHLSSKWIRNSFHTREKWNSFLQAQPINLEHWALTRKKRRTIEIQLMTKSKLKWRARLKDRNKGWRKCNREFKISRNQWHQGNTCSYNLIKIGPVLLLNSCIWMYTVTIKMDQKSWISKNLQNMSFCSMSSNKFRPRWIFKTWWNFYRETFIITNLYWILPIF
jgi:hypothetical protein